jgi:hypothetical protein
VTRIDAHLMAAQLPAGSEAVDHIRQLGVEGGSTADFPGDGLQTATTSPWTEVVAATGSRRPLPDGGSSELGAPNLPFRT